MADDGSGAGEAAGGVARAIIERTGGTVRLALPLGLGKANSIANALTRAACEDSSIDLKILTALTLQRPRTENDLQRRFIGKAGDRLFGRYPPLLYAEMTEAGTLPDNIEVREFFLQAGHWLGSSYAQRHHVAANYTHALAYVLDFRPNVVAQLVARDAEGRFSLSCNTDITVDLLAARSARRADFILAAEVHNELPFMGGPAIAAAEEFDLVIDEPRFELFSVVRRPVSLQDMAIGLNVSRLVPDGGTLQIGIGSIGDAIAHALLLRERQNDPYRALLDANPFGAVPPEDHRGRFETGLYAVTEMLVGGILELFEAGVIRREVHGAAVHAAFFVECRDFYRKLREMPAERRDKIRMMPVSFTNQLYGEEAQKRAARTDARFINNAMMATCLGALVSDGLADGRVVSGVGGQFNFVEQAFALEGARSVMTLNATRAKGGRAESNVIWSYANQTVPRHYRDIVVTEYGVADLRGKSDEECVAAMLAVADSRFQPHLMETAKAAGKIALDYELPARFRQNSPERLEEWLAPARQKGLLPQFPFGTDFTETEQRLLPALGLLRQASGSKMRLAGLALRGMMVPAANAAETACLARLDLDNPSSLAERLTAWLVRGALAENGKGR